MSLCELHSSLYIRNCLTVLSKRTYVTFIVLQPRSCDVDNNLKPHSLSWSRTPLPPPPPPPPPLNDPTKPPPLPLPHSPSFSPVLWSVLHTTSDSFRSPPPRAPEIGPADARCRRSTRRRAASASAGRLLGHQGTQRGRWADARVV